MSTFNEFQLSGYNATKREAGKIWAQIAEEYKRALIEIEAQLDKVYSRLLTGVDPKDYYNVLLQFGRLDSLMDKTIKAYNEAAVKAGKLQINASRVSITNNYYRQQYAVNFALSADTFTAMSDDVVKISVAGTPKAWADINARTQAKIERTFGSLNAYQPKYGTLADVLSKNRNDDIAKIRSAINQGMIQGKSASQVARDLKRIFDTTTSNAERIFRTENHRNRALGDWANFNQAQAEGLDLWREIVSTLDDRTRAQSAAVDGRLDKDGTGFRYPDGNKYLVPGSTGVPRYDINDRERTIEVIPGVDGDKLRRGRNPITGENEVFSYRDFPQWTREHNLRRNRYGELLPVE
jgi:hypothetical protein